MPCRRAHAGRPVRPLAALAAGGLGGLALLAREALFPRRSALEAAMERSLADGLGVPTALRAAIPVGVGVGFGLPYAWVWRRGVLGPSVGGVATLGLLHGLATAAAEPLLRRFRPDEAVRLPPLAVWAGGAVVDHVMYALVTVGTYRLFCSLSR